MSKISKHTSTISEGRLTKELFMRLAPGLYLVSSEAGDEAKPVFAEILSPAKGREEQWKVISSTTAVGKPCYVSKSKSEFDAWHKARVEEMLES